MMNDASDRPETFVPPPAEENRSAVSFALVVIFWTLVIAALAGWDYYQSWRGSLANARTAARHSFAKDLTFRQWASGHGGVYAPISPNNPPNPYLEQVPERDVVTPSGRILTLICPSYMFRQVHERDAEPFGIRAHIASLRPMRPENAPDAWEREALQAFERGENERSALKMIDDAPYLRLMRPIKNEPGCLKCHVAPPAQGETIRGGISVSIPWKPYQEAMWAVLPFYLLGYGGLWLLGLLGIGVARRRLRAYLADRLRIEAELRQSEARYHSLFANHHSVMLLIDPETSLIVDANPAACTYYGYAHETLRGMKVSAINSLSPEQIQDEMAKAKALLRNHFEFRHRLASGELRDVEVFCGPVEFSGQRLLYSIIHDVTDRKMAETALKQRTLELEERGAELERFTYAASHDLKSPLVTIKAFLGFLEQDLASRKTERIATDLDYVRGATNKMGTLLDELLQMSRLGRIINEPTQVAFGELLREVLAVVGGQIATRAVEVRIDADELILFGDRPRLVEIWQNLVDNAVKYLGDQPAPRVDIGFVRRDTGETVFHVRDNGMGIEPRFAEKIFGLFEQLDKQSEGSGLGLALVKRIVELYGGRIWVESAGPGHGATFYFTLPRALCAPDAQE